MEMIQEWTNFAKNGRASWDLYKNQYVRIFTNDNSYGYNLIQTEEKQNLLEKLLESRMKTVYKSF